MSRPDHGRRARLLCAGLDAERRRHLPAGRRRRGGVLRAFAADGFRHLLPGVIEPATRRHLPAGQWIRIGAGMPARPARQVGAVVLSDRSGAAGRRFVPSKHGAATSANVLRRFTVSSRPPFYQPYPTAPRYLRRAPHRVPCRPSAGQPCRPRFWLLSSGSAANAGGRLMGLRRAGISTTTAMWFKQRYRRLRRRARRARPAHHSFFPAMFSCTAPAVCPQRYVLSPRRPVPLRGHIRVQSPHPAVFDAAAWSCAARSAAGSRSAAGLSADRGGRDGRLHARLRPERRRQHVRAPIPTCRGRRSAHCRQLRGG